MKLTIKIYFNKNSFIKNILKNWRVRKTLSEKRERDLIIAQEFYEDPNKKPENEKKLLMIITTFPQDVRKYSYKEYLNVFVMFRSKEVIAQSRLTAYVFQITYNETYYQGHNNGYLSDIINLKREVR